MGRPSVGDLGYHQAPGSQHRELGIVVGHGDNDTVKMFIFGATHPQVEAGHFVPFETTEDGNIPPPPPPEPAPPPPDRPTW